MSVLQLGCGFRPLDGAINHDRTPHSPHVDIGWDLDQFPWPWADDAFSKVIALDVMEHLHAEVAIWLAECWRILGPDGQLVLRLPAWDNPVSYRDPTHRRVYHEETFDYWDPDRQLHKDYGRFYWDDMPARWWQINTVERVNAGDLGFVLTKRI